MLGWLLRAAIATALLSGGLYVAGVGRDGADRPGQPESVAAAFKSCPPGVRRQGCRRDRGLSSDVSVAIHVYEYGFQNTNTEIKAGQAVRWQNVGTELHTIRPTTLEGERVFKRAFRLGTTRHVFDRPGVYPYHCTVHPRQMRGRITVIE